MAQQLLWLEVLLKLSAGVLLIIAPAAVAVVLGLPRPGAAFWPRLLGAVLAGIAVASALYGFLLPGRGLSLAGNLAVNLATATMLFATLMLAPPAKRRGRVVLWALTALLVVLGLFEIAYA